MPFNHIGFRLLPLCLALLFGAQGIPDAHAQKARDKYSQTVVREQMDELGWSPPGVESGTIRPLEKATPAGNALLEVRFEAGDGRLKKGVPIFPDGKPVVLHDDGKDHDDKAGDGVFSAVVQFNFKELGPQAQVAAAQASKAKPQAIFRGREIIGVESKKLVADRAARLASFQNTARILEARSRINLLALPVTVSPASVDPARSLMVTDLSVVRDPLRTLNPCDGSGAPDGKWTFKHLVTQMVDGTGVDPADFVEDWLGQWLAVQTVSSGFSAPVRAPMGPLILDKWPRTLSGKLDLDKPPFRLSAIVNRMDLGSNPVYGGGSAGEGRFVFGVWDRDAGCKLLPFSVILEYGVPRKGCNAIRDWAKDWVALSAIPFGSVYNQALEDITEKFAKAGAGPGKPNGSALNQLRTNENALNSLWELREFRISDSSHLLFEDTVKQTPDETLNNTAVIADFVNQNAASILLDKHVVPNLFPDPPPTPFMAARSLVSPGQLQTHFRAPGINDNQARFHFSLNTCTACHIRETGTNDISGTPASNNAFLHVDPRNMPAKLSRFLTGSTASISDSPDIFQVDDPVLAGVQHGFNDLDLRRQKLANTAGSSCFRFIHVTPHRFFDRFAPLLMGQTPPQIDDPRFSNLNDPVRMPH